MKGKKNITMVTTVCNSTYEVGFLETKLGRGLQEQQLYTTLSLFKQKRKQRALIHINSNLPILNSK